MQAMKNGEKKPDGNKTDKWVKEMEEKGAKMQCSKAVLRWSVLSLCAFWYSMPIRCETITCFGFEWREKEEDGQRKNEKKKQQKTENSDATRATGETWLTTNKSIK